MAATVMPGDTVTMHVSITSSSGGEAARISINTNGAPVSFVTASANSSGGNVVAPPGGLSGRFSIMDIEGVATGFVGSVTFRVNSNAAPGTYTITASGSMAATGISGSVNPIYLTKQILPQGRS